MVSRIDAINITARDHESLGAFWQQLLALQEDPDNPNNPGDPVTVFLTEPVAVNFVFQPADEGKEFTPRIHFDLNPVGSTRDEEVERLKGLGATVVADRRRENGSGYVTMSDVDGNEFCVQRSPEEVAAAGH
ncbi:VOC family protein [Microbacterium bovistercoris]|uniref:VOC family protein n=1 Tax=Microbacterium bovistercoris TaxID=2293570 RepID=A0A371NPE4_9MICO|nr:VOC family protein [Microbacterium bovistercoris]REJ04056.1 VOC family protein [Microbacterium bovistercoris]